MSEKRFEVINARWEGKGEAVAFEDIQTNQVYFAENQEECERIVDLLNEQLSIIRRDEVSMKTMMSNIEKLEKENEQLQKENIELKKLRKYCAEWMGVKEENLYDVVR